MSRRNFILQGSDLTAGALGNESFRSTTKRYRYNFLTNVQFDEL